MGHKLATIHQQIEYISTIATKKTGFEQDIMDGIGVHVLGDECTHSALRTHRPTI